MKTVITTTAATDEQFCGDGSADIELHGTWNGASIDFQVKTQHDDWLTLATYTEDTVDVMELTHPVTVRLKASAVGGSTSVKAAILA